MLFFPFVPLLFVVSLLSFLNFPPSCLNFPLILITADIRSPVLKFRIQLKSLVYIYQSRIIGKELSLLLGVMATSYLSVPYCLVRNVTSFPASLKKIKPSGMISLSFLTVRNVSPSLDGYTGVSVCRWLCSPMSSHALSSVYKCLSCSPPLTKIPVPLD